MTANGNGSNGSNGSNGMKSRNYIRWDAEDQHHSKGPIQQRETLLRWNHAGTQGVVKGELIVGDLPDHLAQTLFSTPGQYPIAMRYSTEPGDPGLDDRILQPRGLGIKVFNVPGEMFEGKNFPTQDIESNSTPALDIADTKTSKGIIDLRIKYGGNQKELYRHLEARKDTDLQKAHDQVRNTHLSYEPYLWRLTKGKLIEKSPPDNTRRQPTGTVPTLSNIALCLAPSSETQKKQYEETVNRYSQPNDILSEWLKEFHKNHEAEYLFQVQLCENLDDQPVKYAGKIWDEEKYPWKTVAKIVVPKQDSMITARKTFWEDLRLDPWHGLKTFQPVGSSNRLRKVVYPASAALRHKMNGRRGIDIQRTDEIPDGGFVELTKQVVANYLM